MQSLCFEDSFDFIYFSLKESKIAKKNHWKTQESKTKWKLHTGDHTMSQIVRIIAQIQKK